MKIACYIEPQRHVKTSAFMQAFARGCGGQLFKGEASNLHHADVHVFWGHRFFSQEAVPIVRARGEHHIIIDNGFWEGANGRIGQGTYRMIIDGPKAKLPPPGGLGRAMALGVGLKPWRQDGSHILLATPGPHFGLPWGISVKDWEQATLYRLRKATGRPIRVRRKGDQTPLEASLQGAYALVTHSSSVSVKAICEGIPVFCEETCAAAPVGNKTFKRIETPEMPDRTEWLSQITYSQWDIEEYRNGSAWAHVKEMFQ